MFTKNLGELSQQFENKLSVLMKSCKQFSYLSTFSDPNSFMTDGAWAAVVQWMVFYKRVRLWCQVSNIILVQILRQ